MRVSVAGVSFAGIDVEAVGLLIRKQDIAGFWRGGKNRKTFVIVLYTGSSKDRELFARAVGRSIKLPHANRFVGIIYVAQLIVHHNGFYFFFTAEPAKGANFFAIHKAVGIGV